MPDILNDPPSAYQPGQPVIDPAFEDFGIHDEARQALLTLNQLAFGHRGAPGLTVRSVVEDGAVADGVTDNLASFQATVDAVAAAGGGIALVPPMYPGVFHWNGTLTIPANVILRGLGDRSVVRGHPVAGSPAIGFASGLHRGGVENLVLLGNEAFPRGTGIDLTGAHFLRLRNLQIWDFQLGIQMSDGFTSYAGHNHLSDFEVNRCHVGIRAWLHCNQASVMNGRIWRCRNNGEGTALDIQSAEALAIAHVAVENFDVGVRIRGRVHVSLRDVYYEADNPDENFPLGFWLDIRPEKGSTVLMENSIANVSRSLILGGSLEDAITNDERSHIYNGAKRHHAAAPERNLIENGDFHRAASPTIPQGWTKNFDPKIAESTDFVTGGRSYDITQVSNANDGVITAFTVPETTDYVTVMVRYKNVSSAEPLFRVGSGANAALFVDPVPPSKEWRVAAITVDVDPAAAGVVSIILTADQTAKGGQIRVDEAWAVVGATAAPPRAHGHRFEILPEPVNVVKRTGLKADAELGPIDLTELTGLGGAPRGVIGAILSLRGTATPAGLADPNKIGAMLSRAVRPFIRDAATNQRWSLDILCERLEHDRQVVLRGTSFFDGIKVFNGLMATTYRVDLVGWVLPS
jgi:hypothetical protein